MTGHHSPIALYTDGKIEIKFRHLTRPPLDDEQARRELLARVNEMPGVSFPIDVIDRRPTIPLSLLSHDPAALQQLKRVLEWVEQVAAAPLA